MEPFEWGIVGAPMAVLTSVAGYLAVKTIRHGEQLAALLSHKEDTKERFDRQDRILESVNSKLDQLLMRAGIRPSPPPLPDRRRE